MRVLFWFKKRNFIFKKDEKVRISDETRLKIIIGFITTKATGLSENISQSNAHRSQVQGGEDWTWRNGDSKSIQSTKMITKEKRNVVIGLVEI